MYPKGLQGARYRLDPRRQRCRVWRAEEFAEGRGVMISPLCACLRLAPIPSAVHHPYRYVRKVAGVRTGGQNWLA
jgi:hypothetical protein